MKQTLEQLGYAVYIDVVSCCVQIDLNMWNDVHGSLRRCINHLFTWSCNESIIILSASLVGTHACSHTRVGVPRSWHRVF